MTPSRSLPDQLLASADRALRALFAPARRPGPHRGLPAKSHQRPNAAWPPG